MISRVEDSVVAAGRARAGWIRRGLPTAAAWASVALAGAWLALLPGCGEKEEAAVAPPPPPPPPPEPDRVELSLLEDELRPDARIAFPASSAPYDPTLARAVYRFAGALASGDAGAMRPMLDQPSREVLDWMRDDGTWSDSTASIEAVAVPHLDQTPASRRAARTCWDGRRGGPRGRGCSAGSSRPTPSCRWPRCGSISPRERWSRGASLNHRRGAIDA